MEIFEAYGVMVNETPRGLSFSLQTKDTLHAITLPPEKVADLHAFLGQWLENRKAA